MKIRIPSHRNSAFYYNLSKGISHAWDDYNSFSSLNVYFRTENTINLILQSFKHNGN